MFEAYIHNDYLRTFVVLLGLFFIVRVAIFLGEKIVLRLTKKTKTKLDDILLERLSKPVTFGAFLIALEFAIRELPLTPETDGLLTRIILTTGILIIAYCVYTVANTLVISLLKNFAKKTKSSLDDSIISLFNSVLNLTLIILSLIYILEVWGVQVGPLLAGLGVAGLAVALALQPVLSNVFSGASMILDHSIKVGDWVKIDDGSMGIVDKIGLRSTRVRTFDNEVVIVPNTKLAESIIQNITLPEPIARVVVPFGVAYGTDPEKVRKVVLKEIDKIPGVIKEEGKEPAVRFLEMGDSSLNFKAYFFIDSFENRLSTIDQATTRIYNALGKAKIEIPFPQMDVHIKKK